MIYLLLNVMSQTAFMHLFRRSQVTGRPTMPVATINYLLASVGSLMIALVAGGPSSLRIGPIPTTCALINGALFVASLLVTMGGFRIAGVGITSALTASSLVIPSLVGWCVWGEKLKPTGWVALLIVVPAMFLMRPHSPVPALRLSRGQEWILGGILLVAGSINVVHKFATVELKLLPSAVAGNAAYLAALFGMAAIGTGIAAWFSNQRADLATLGIGAVIGLVNIASMVTLMMTLSVLPGVVVFPVAGCLLIISTNITSRFFWGERIQPRQIIGIGLAMAVVVLASV